MSYSEQLLDAIQNHDFSQNKHLLKEALDNDDPEVLSSLAENLTGLGFTDLAKEIYRALIAKFPKEDLFKVYLAEIMLNDGDDDDGLSLLYNVPESSSAYLDSLLVQADYYQTNGLIETAKDKLIRALQLAPEEDAIKFGLAEIEYLSGNYEEAAKVIREHANSILDIDSKYEAGLVLLSVGDDKQAIKFLDEVIEQSPDYVNAYPLLAQAYDHQHDNEQVLRTAQAGLAYNELDETLYSMGARAAANLNELDTARDLLEKGLKVAPDNSDLRMQLSNLYVHEHQAKENIALFSNLDEESVEPQAHWNMALSYEDLDDNQKAQSEFLLAYPDFKDNSDFLRQMIIFFNVQNNDEITKQLLERYLKLAPEDAEMQDLYNNL